MFRLRTPVLLLFVLNAFWLACGEQDELVGPISQSQDNDTVGQSTDSIYDDSTLWDKFGSDTYVIDQEVMCFSPWALNGQVRLWVQDNEIIHVVRLSDGQELDEPRTGLYRTIDELFNLAISAENHADIYNIAYDSLYGYPHHISIDWNLDCYDDEISYTTTLIQISD